jgi:hypothetical protein
MPSLKEDCVEKSELKRIITLGNPRHVDRKPSEIRQFSGVETDMRCCRGAKTAHPEKTRRERHLRSSRTFQRDRLSPSDADSSVSHCSEHTVAIKNAANHPHVSTPTRSRGEDMWVLGVVMRGLRWCLPRVW